MLKSFKSYANLLANLSAIRNIVTPFTPHLICGYHFSEEIYDKRVRWINRKSKNLLRHAEDVKRGDWIFCDIGLIPSFTEDILPRIKHPFVLITGNWHLPGLSESSYTDRLLEEEKVVLWFSQNMCIEHPKCHPFPYGVSHVNARRVLKEMRIDRGTKRKEIYFSPFKIHNHYSDSVKAARAALLSRTEPPLPMPQYLKRLHQHCFVTSPQGDRPDTYRHWESIALGCMPISDLPPIYRRMFGENMIYVDDMRDVLGLKVGELACNDPDSSMVTVPYWIDHVARHAAF